MGTCSCPAEGSASTISWRGSCGTVGKRPSTQPNKSAECSSTLARIAIQGQRRLPGSLRSSGGRNGTPPHTFERSAQALGRRPEPLSPYCQRNPKEPFACRSKGAAGQDHHSGLL